MKRIHSRAQDEHTSVEHRFFDLWRAERELSASLQISVLPIHSKRTANSRHSVDLHRTSSSFVLRAILDAPNAFRYAAPELFQSLPYSPDKVDVWVRELRRRRTGKDSPLQSLGVLLYIFVCGHLPFDSQNFGELRKQVLSGQVRLPFYLSSGKRSSNGRAESTLLLLLL